MHDLRRDGFTLVEIIIVMALLGLVAAVITGVVAVVIRTTDPTESRTEESRSIRGLTTWMSQDVAAATPDTGFDLTPSATPSCTGVEGSRLFKLTWTESSSSTTEYVADYRLVVDGTGERQVHRFACSGSPGGAPFSGGTSNRLTGPLGPTTPVVNPITDGVSTVGVALTVWTNDLTPEPMRVEASTRNPAVTLPIVPTTNTTIPSATTAPPTTAPPTTAPPTTAPPTTAPPTTAPPSTAPPTCAITRTNLPLSASNGDDETFDTLEDDVTLEFEVTAACGSMTIRYQRYPTGPVIEDGLTPNSGTLRTVVLRNGGNRDWSDGPHTITVYNGSTPLSPTYIFTVT